MNGRGRGGGVVRGGGGPWVGGWGGVLHFFLVLEFRGSKQKKDLKKSKFSAFGVWGCHHHTTSKEAWTLTSYCSRLRIRLRLRLRIRIRLRIRLLLRLLRPPLCPPPPFPAASPRPLRQGFSTRLACRAPGAMGGKKNVVFHLTVTNRRRRKGRRERNAGALATERGSRSFVPWGRGG